MANVSLVDPKYVDGDPHEVAVIAGTQAQAAIELSIQALDGLIWAAHGSWLTQEYHRLGQMPDKDAFGQSPLGRKLEAAKADLNAVHVKVIAAAASAAYDPKSH